MSIANHDFITIAIQSIALQRLGDKTRADITIGKKIEIKGFDFIQQFGNGLERISHGVLGGTPVIAVKFVFSLKTARLQKNGGFDIEAIVITERYGDTKLKGIVKVDIGDRMYDLGEALFKEYTEAFNGIVSEEDMNAVDKNLLMNFNTGTATLTIPYM